MYLRRVRQGGSLENVFRVDDGNFVGTTLPPLSAIITASAISPEAMRLSATTR
jgi:hypothetical protein